MSFFDRVGIALCSAALFTLICWGAFSLIGEPPIDAAAHNLTSFYFWTGWIYALAVFEYRDDS